MYIVYMIMYYNTYIICIYQLEKINVTNWFTNSINHPRNFEPKRNINTKPSTQCTTHFEFSLTHTLILTVELSRENVSVKIKRKEKSF